MNNVPTVENELLKLNSIKKSVNTTISMLESLNKYMARTNKHTTENKLMILLDKFEFIVIMGSQMLKTMHRNDNHVDSLENEKCVNEANQLYDILENKIDMLADILLKDFDDIRTLTSEGTMGLLEQKINELILHPKSNVVSNIKNDFQDKAN